MRRTVSDNGVEFAKRWETFKPVPYYATADEKARGILTWGYGHTGTRAQAPARITEPDALALLRQDMGKAERKANELVHPVFNQAQFDAIVDVCFNVGIGVILKDNVLGDFDDAVRLGNVSECRRIMGQFIYQNKKPLLGLRRRTAGRLALFDGKSAAEAEAIGRAVK